MASNKRGAYPKHFEGDGRWVYDLVQREKKKAQKSGDWARFEQLLLIITGRK